MPKNIVSSIPSYLLVSKQCSGHGQRSTNGTASVNDLLPQPQRPGSLRKESKWDLGQHSGTEADFRLLHVNIQANNVPYAFIHHQWAKSGPIEGRRSTQTYAHPITREH